MPLALVRRKNGSSHWLTEADRSTNREDVILPFISRGSVLDLGVVDSWRAKESTSDRLSRFATSLHAWICEHNQDVLGVDIDAEGVAMLAERGFKVTCANVETMKLGRLFDTIIAGEIIEHLPNAGRALSSVRKHLKPGGRLILSTPNPFFVGQIWKIIKYGIPQVHEEHTCWFDPLTLGNVLEMHGFTVERLVWLSPPRRHGRWRLLPARLRHYWSANFLIVAANSAGGKSGVLKTRNAA